MPVTCNRPYKKTKTQVKAFGSKSIKNGKIEYLYLLRTLINEIKDGNSKQCHSSEQLTETMSNNANDVATAVKTGIKEIDL